MKAISAGYAVPEAAVMAIEAGCDGVLICSGDHATQARRARGAGARGGGRNVCRSGRVRGRVLKRQRRAKERFLASSVAAAKPAAGRALREGAWPRRAPRDSPKRWRASCDAQAPRAGCRRPCPPWSPPPAPSLAKSSTAACRSSGASGSCRLYDDSVFARQRYVAGSAAGKGRGDSRRLAGSIDRRADRRSRRLRQRAAPAAPGSRGGPSRVEAVCRLQRSHVDADRT